MLCHNNVGGVVYVWCSRGSAGYTNNNIIAYRKSSCTPLIKEIGTRNSRCGRVLRTSNDDWTSSGDACCPWQHGRSNFSVSLRVREHSLLGRRKVPCVRVS